MHYYGQSYKLYLQLLIKKSIKNYKSFSQEILDYVNGDVSKIDFPHDVLRKLISFSGCEAVEIMIKEHNKFFSCKITQQVENSFQYSAASFINEGGIWPCEEYE